MGIEIDGNYSDSKECRFHRGIYLHYIGLNDNKTDAFKRLEKEDFYNILYKKLQTIKKTQSDKNNIYRISDSKDIWSLIGLRKIAGLFSTTTLVIFITDIIEILFYK